MEKLSHFLMCPPKYFDVVYAINPWMQNNCHGVSREVMLRQWQRLHTLISEHAEVALLEPREGLPDMPFTANAGCLLDRRMVLSNFKYPERRGEEQHYRAWFEQHHYQTYDLPDDVFFEGAGDALLDREQAILWAGHGLRSDLRSHVYLSQWLEIEVISLTLVNPRFYHLDTCFCPLAGGYVMYYPEAFHELSRRLIEDKVRANKRIEVDSSDAYNFACNAINIGNLIILHKASSRLSETLSRFNFQLMQTDLSEFFKAGGAAKCLALKLDERCLNRI